MRRAGHTEATVDLARMAGLSPAGVLCEILDETGDRASREQLQEIADRLVISRNTAKSQVASIYQKLGVSSRSDAVSRARRLGILNP